MICLHSHISIYSNLMLFNSFKYMNHISADSMHIHEYKAGNDVSEFTHSNCITLSYYSSPKHNESDS